MGEVLIKCFETPVRKYFYDRVLDSIVAVNDDEYALLKKVEVSKYVSSNAKLKKFTDNGLLQETIVEEIEHPETQNLGLLSEHYLGNLILQVTQQCNLRCKYCAYSGNYYNRTHSSERMSFDTARKAIDFYLDRSDKMDDLSLSFYGGESLLEFALIKKCVEYITEHKGDRTVRFPMTTNGTLLTQEVIEFLVKYKFSILISLDGNEESHNVNRQFKTGGGTFDVILRNLRALKEYDEEYYKENVMFNCVISGTTDLKATYDFYANSDLFDAKMINFTYVVATDIKDDTILKITQDNIRVQRLEYIKTALSILEKRQWCNTSRMLRSQLSDVELLYEYLHRHTQEGKTTHHGGPCIPGIRRLFVDTHGKFFPCERVSEEDQEMCIGSLQEGFAYDRMDFYLNHGKLIAQECIHCWNLRECSFCLSGISKKNHNLTAEMLRCNCEKSKRSTLNLFERLCPLVELGYHGNEDLKVIR